MFRRHELFASTRARVFALAGLSALLIWGGLYWAAERAPRSGTRLDVPAPLLAAVRPGPLVPEGEFAVSVWRDGAWRLAGRLGADKYNRTQLLVLRDLPASGPVRLRVEKHGGGGAHLDALLLNGQAPLSVQGAPPAKLTKADNDIANAHEGPIEAEFALPFGKRAGAILTLAGRIEPVEIGKEPVKFPVRNAHKPVTRESAFYTYRLGSNAGALALDGELSPERLGEPLFYGWQPNGSGHPNSMIYGWAKDDGQTLYVAVDFTGDNTLDGDVDYAKVYVRQPNGLREFKVTVPEQRWGTPGFTYTDKVAWQHKVYEFAIPLRELNMDGAGNGNVQLAFALYGTLSAGEYNSALAFDSESNCFLRTHWYAEGNGVGDDGLVYVQSLDEAGGDLGSDVLVHTVAIDGSGIGITRVAFDPTTGRYLVVWEDEISGNDILGRLAEADGTPVGGTIAIAVDAGADAFQPAVAANTQDGGFLVVWQHEGTDIYGALVSAAGVPGSDFVVDADTSFQESPRVAYDPVGDGYLVVFRDLSDGIAISAVPVSPSGSAGSKVAVYTGESPSDPDTAADTVNGGFLVVMVEFSNINGELVSGEGAEVRPGIDLHDFGSGTGGQPAVAFDPVSSEYLVAWDDTRNGGSVDVYAQVVAADGDLIGSNTAIADSGDTEESASVAANSLNGGFVVAYEILAGASEREIVSTLFGSVAQSASRSLPPGAGFALLGLAGLAALLWLAQRRLPRLRPAYATVAMVLAVHVAVMIAVACSSSSSDGGSKKADEPPTTCQLE